MPTLVLGGGGAVAAVMTNQLLLFLAAEYMILSGGGDFQLILRSILTDKRESLYCAHPYECAFVVFEKYKSEVVKETKLYGKTVKEKTN